MIYGHGGVIHGRNGVIYGGSEWSPNWYAGGLIQPGQVTPSGQIHAGLDYIDRTYGTRRSRAKRHLRRAWAEIRAALAEYR